MNYRDYLWRWPWYLDYILPRVKRGLFCYVGQWVPVWSMFIVSGVRTINMFSCYTSSLYEIEGFVMACHLSVLRAEIKAGIWKSNQLNSNTDRVDRDIISRNMNYSFILAKSLYRDPNLLQILRGARMSPVVQSAGFRSASYPYLYLYLSFPGALEVLGVQ